jgi:hypothetical protein
MQSQAPVWLSVELAQALQRDLSSCAYALLSFLMSEVRRIETAKSLPATTLHSSAAAAAAARPAPSTPTVPVRLPAARKTVLATAVRRIGDKLTGPIEVSSSSGDGAVDAGKGDVEGDGDEDEEEQRAKLRTQPDSTGSRSEASYFIM